MSSNRPCPECHDLDRRRFIKNVGGAAAATAAAPLFFDPRFAHAAPATDSAAETVVKQFYASLSEAQRKVVCFRFNNPKRTRISPNWHITEPLIGGDFYTDEQRSLVNEIVKNVTSGDGYARFIRQMDDDDGGLDSYSVAIFGDPTSGKFEWELTGRHLTLRADGNSVDKAAFGGPIVYGHGEEDDVAKNLFYYQTQRANEVFQSLDAGQAKAALLKEAPSESDVKLQDEPAALPGVAVGSLSNDQQELVRQTLKSLLDPYRQEDVDEAFQVVEASGGMKSLHMAFYQEGDINDDKVWDIWRIEGPSVVCHFRGAPHVHAYINIASK